METLIFNINSLNTSMASKSSKNEKSVKSSNISDTGINLKQITPIYSLNDNHAIGDHFKKTNFGQYINSIL